MKKTSKQSVSRGPVDVRAAVQSARRYAANWFPPLKPADFSLEEVKLSRSGGTFAITLGMPNLARIPKNPAIAKLFQSASPPMIYKLFTVKRSDGEVLSMEIREPTA